MDVAVRPDITPAPLHSSPTAPGQQHNVGPGKSNAAALASTPTLLYYQQGSRIIVAPKPADDPSEAAIQEAFDQAGATTCPVEFDEVAPSEPTWPLFYALYLDQQGRQGEIDRNLLGRAAGEMVQSGGFGEKPELPDDMPGSAGPQVTPAGGIAAGTMKPGPWQPLGQQPIPFYVGNQAHKQIAEHYRAAHAGQLIFTNSTPLSSVLVELESLGIPGIDTRRLGDSAALRPDILNVPLGHLYEIKPERSASLGAGEAMVYCAALSRAGFVVTLGPTTDPGTRGVIPAPGGYFRFWSPVMGVIVYQYSRKLPQPVPVAVPQAHEQFDEQPDTGSNLERGVESSWESFWDWGYWEEVTGLTGTALVLYLILSEGSRLFPPRNLAPVP